MHTLWAFCSELQNITLPNGLKKIEYVAFTCCHKLTSINIPDTVENIGMNAFSNSGLTEIDIPDSVKVIKERAFTKCRSLKQVRLPNELRYIGVNTFKKVAEDCEIVYNETQEKIIKAIMKEHGGKYRFTLKPYRLPLFRK